MGYLKPSAALREFDRLAAAPGETSVRAALAWIRAQRPHFMALPDPLARARFLLRAGTLRETEQPLQELVEDLLVALRVFRAYQLPHDMALCLSRLAFWYIRQGLHLPGLLCSHHALLCPELPEGERLRLKVARASRLVYERQLPAAWDVLAQLDRDRLPVGQGWMIDALRCLLHLAEALRARREVSELALDLEPGPLDGAAYEHHVVACRSSLAGLSPAEQAMPANRHLRAMGAALAGDVELVRTLFRAWDGRPPGTVSERVEFYNHAWCLRILGDARAAQALHLANLGVTNAPAYPHLEALSCLDLYACALALGDPGGGATWLARYLRVQIRLDAVNQQALQALLTVLDFRRTDDELLLGAKGAQATLPIPADAEPASLGKVETLFLSRLPRRTPLASLAAEMGVSIRTLQLAARRYRHCTLSDMLRRRVMDRALELLRHSDMSIAQVAAALGYSEASSLSRDVRRHFGCTPRALRNGGALRPRPVA